RAAAHRLAHRLPPGAVSHEARHPARLGPAAVAIHDDRDVARDVAAGDELLESGRSRAQGVSGGAVTGPRKARRLAARAPARLHHSRAKAGMEAGGQSSMTSAVFFFSSSSI